MSWLSLQVKDIACLYFVEYLKEIVLTDGSVNDKIKPDVHAFIFDLGIYKSGARN